MFYMLLALLLFVLTPAGIITRQALSAYVFVALFTTAPLWSVIAALPNLGRGQTALDRIEKVGLMLAGGIVASKQEAFSKHALRIQFQQVSFTYSGTKIAAASPWALWTSPWNRGSWSLLPGERKWKIHFRQSPHWSLCAGGR